MIKCRNCKSSKLKKIITVGSQPLSGICQKKKKFNLKKYPLNLYKCKNCQLIQLSKVAPANEMYGLSYGYWTGLSDLMINHMSKKDTKLNVILSYKQSNLIVNYVH